jgi:DNA polymerase-4
MSIDEVACRLDKVQQQAAVARKLGQEIKHEIQSQVGACLTSSIGVSANKLLAKPIKPVISLSKECRR